MKILGIDPGLVCTGWGIVEKRNESYYSIAYGTISTKSKESLAKRLAQIHSGLIKIIDKYNPSALSIEDVFVKKNIRSALMLGHARGVAMLAGVQANLSVIEYTPREVKKAITGRGGASKEQVQFMLKTLLNLKELPTPLDASDALSIALCALFKFA